MDGCTFFPDGWWRLCCDAHDLAYLLGEISQVLADADLATCVAGTAIIFGPIIGGIMWLGIRLFGRFAWRKHRKRQD